jgi:hypothetical protein
VEDDIVMDWSTVFSELLKLALAVAVPLVVLALGRLAVAALKAAETYLAEHDLGVAETLANAAIEFAEVKLKDITGAERMAWVLEYLAARGIDIDNVEAERIYQEFARYYKREQAAAAAPAVQVPSVWSDPGGGYTITGASSPAATEVAPNA